MNRLVDTHMLPPPSPDTAAVMAVSDKYFQHVVRMSESSRSTVRNSDSVHSSLSSIADINYNGGGVLSNSYTSRLPDPLKYLPNTYFNAASCYTSLLRSTSQNTNSLHSASISQTDTNYNADGFCPYYLQGFLALLTPSQKHRVECCLLFHICFAEQEQIDWRRVFFLHPFVGCKE